MPAARPRSPTAVFRSLTLKARKQSVTASSRSAHYRLAMLGDEPERNWGREPKKYEDLDQNERSLSVVAKGRGQLRVSFTECRIDVTDLGNPATFPKSRVRTCRTGQTESKAVHQIEGTLFALQQPRRQNQQHRRGQRPSCGIDRRAVLGSFAQVPLPFFARHTRSVPIFGTPRCVRSHRSEP
jgi:hypothetical protein